ncbi:GNAT family N-acetyltransferase [Fictibacillus phosphorivorans]|uniref:GNAT family N-acetyltransferase n=1 Tax=Fictibacillus phosphorivorans TaxID=1221500 RepID=UPI00203DEAE6|nr:GNAT family N-acetyltransferase [Fictibacillus phosphorivorans]MCM3718052.1 GNAT family N-acetyltransferase [Fictibacillus phosphorivorans]MCM3775679.1 GNAT family N-acetyltransferase [Fictibacillus phosphorivorans]
MMRLETERLTIVPVDHQLVERLSPEYYEIHGFIKSYLDKLQEDESLLGWGVWFVIEKESGRIVGDLGFKGKPVDHTVEIGYGIIPSAQGQGYATEAAHKLIEWSLSTKLVSRVIAECLEDNIASIHVLEKLGFEETGAKDKMLKWKWRDR